MTEAEVCAVRNALYRGDRERARALVDAGADADAVADNPMRVQPLHSAAALGEPVELLLAAGVDARSEELRRSGRVCVRHRQLASGDRGADSSGAHVTDI